MDDYWKRRICLGAVWLAFIIRGAFYCAEQPLWEGYDEWAHYAYIQRLSDEGTLPSRTDPIPRFLDRSLQLAPLSRSAAEVGPGTITHDWFWQLPQEERARRHRELLRLTPAPEPGEPEIGARQYEAQQPPLYYLLLAPAYLLTKTLSLPAQVLVLRLLSLAIASCVIFLGYSVALGILHRRDVAMITAILLACLPGLFIQTCRIGNDPAAIVLMSATVLASVRMCQRPSMRGWIAMGLLAGAAALTKAYAIAVWPLPLLLAGLLIGRDRKGWRQTASGFALASAVMLAVAGWWYGQVIAATGTLSGEQLHVAAGGAGRLDALTKMDWLRVADSAAFSHIWVGGWSFLVVRSWMYRVFELIGFIGALGLAVHGIRIVRQASWKHAGDLLIPAVVFATMCAALAYHSLMIFMTHGVSMGPGWYLYAVIVPEVVLLALGIGALFPVNVSRWALAAVCSLAAVLDIFTMHFMLIPYYSGLIRHSASGSLAAFKLPMLASANLFERLSINRPLGAKWIAALWFAYLCATFVLIVIAMAVARKASRENR